MTKDKYENASRLHEKILGLEDVIKTLRCCFHTIEITGRTEGSTPIPVRVSDNIFSAIIAEKEAELEKLKKEFELL